jgi:hypothetical protein
MERIRCGHRANRPRLRLVRPRTRMRPCRASFAGVHALAAAYACDETGSAGLRHACRAQALRHGDVATTMNYTALALLDVARALNRPAQG